jgi:chromosome partitioning protein
MPVMRLTVGNLKGGVAKSTTSIYLACGLARTGRVLLVDADGTNASALDWSSNSMEWPDGIVVVPWPVEDLARKIRAVENDYDHVVVDTGPEQSGLLRQALTVTDELVVPVSPSPMELRKLGHTFQAAAEVDAVSAVTARVLLAKVRSGTRSSIEARQYLHHLGLPVMDAQVHLREAYSLAWGTAPADLVEYEDVLKELTAPVTEEAGS